MPRTRQEAMKRKKNRGRIKKEAPFPILPSTKGDENISSHPPCCYFTGYLQGCSVIVHHSGDMDSLYTMGFFGKGTLSRSEPTFDARQQRVNIPKTNKDYHGGMEVVQTVFTSKRKYLAHLRYRALSDDEESVYNDIVQQEQSQLSAYDGEDEEGEEEDMEDEEEFDEEEEEEEGSLDNNDINALSRFGVMGDDQAAMNTKLTPEEMARMPRSLLVAVLTQASILCKQPIATFLRVPCGLAELETKYKIMRKKQCEFLDDMNKESSLTQQPLSLSSINKMSPSYSNSSGGFGKKGIINLEEGLDDEVVVLNSDEEESKEDKLDEEGEGVDREEVKSVTRKEEEKERKNLTKGWDDSDNEGDAEFWGVGEEEEEEKKKGKVGGDENGKLKDCVDSLENSEKDSSKLSDTDVGTDKVNVEVSVKETVTTLNSSKEHSHDKDVDNEMNVDSVENENAKDSENLEKVCSEVNVTEKNTLEALPQTNGLNKPCDDLGEGIDMKEEKGSDGGGGSQSKEEKDENLKKADIVELNDNEKVAMMEYITTENADKNDDFVDDGKKESSVNGNPPSSSTTTTTTVTTTVLEDEKDSSDDDDDDDVICVEEDSAQPAKLHQYLSRPAQGQGQHSVTVKPVCFLSSITDESKFVNTRLGFRSWGDVLHFNFTGDPTHLPTAVAVHEEGDDKEQKQDTESSNALGKFSKKNSVYERIYPPISSLITSQNSKGSIMKQRHDPVPFLNLALYHLQQRFAPALRRPSSKLPRPQTGHRSGYPATSTPHQNSHSRLHQIQSNPVFKTPALWENIMSQPSQMRNQQKLTPKLLRLQGNSSSPVPVKTLLSSLTSLSARHSSSSSSSSPSYSSVKSLLSTLTSLSPSTKQSPSSSSSSVPSQAPVTPSQLELYLKVFQEDTVNDKETTVEEEKKETGDESNKEENDNSDKMLPKLHTQLGKTKLLKTASKRFSEDNDTDTDSSSSSSSIAQQENKSVNKETALKEFNEMLSGYMASKQISCEQELVLLRILMYDEQSVTSSAIPRDVVSGLKSNLCPGQVSCLLERMDYIQVCVEDRRRANMDKMMKSSNDVITIDLSDDDEEGEDEKEFEKGAGGVTQLLDHDEDKSLGSDGKESEKGNVENRNDNMKDSDCVLNKDGKGEKVRRGSRGGIVESEDKDTGSGLKRRLDSSSEECSLMTAKSKKMKSAESCEDGLGNQISGDVSSITSANINNDNGDKNERVGGDSIISVNSCSDNTVQKTGVDSLIVSEVVSVSGDTRTLGSQDDEKHNKNGSDGVLMCNDNGDGDETDSRSKNDNCDKDNGDVSMSEIVEDDKIIKKQHVQADSELIGNDSNDIEMTEISSKNIKKKERSGENVLDVDHGNVSHSVDVVEDVNEIYVGSSDEEDGTTNGVHNEKRMGGFQHWKWKSCSEPEIGSTTNPYSLRDDENGDRFVVGNTSDEDVDDEEEGAYIDDDDDDGGWMRRRKSKWRPCLKKDPYPTEERLHLMLEEAFFLTFGLGCLRILDQEMSPLSISSLWEKFMIIQEKFIPRYVAYHYFRSKGWVPKAGLKFGCDFILYRDGPPFFHGSYSVVVVPVKEGSLTHMDGENGELDYSRRWTSWIALSGLNRITEHVAKELMICYVIFPKGLTEEDAKSPKCLPRFKVKEVMVSRWVSARERENKDQLEEMP